MELLRCTIQFIRKKISRSCERIWDNQQGWRGVGCENQQAKERSYFQGNAPNRRRIFHLQSCERFRRKLLRITGFQPDTVNNPYGKKWVWSYDELLRMIIVWNQPMIIVWKALHFSYYAFILWLHTMIIRRSSSYDHTQFFPYGVADHCFTDVTVWRLNRSDSDSIE